MSFPRYPAYKEYGDGFALRALYRYIQFSQLFGHEAIVSTLSTQLSWSHLVLPHAPDAWIDTDKTKVGYEIPFNRHFYVFKPPRPLAEIDAELKGVTDRILTMIGGLNH